MVSRKHGEIIFEGKRYWLRDLGSINGTFINTVCPPMSW
jgi:pSer/pThr/pTyr-binding forkhead associated (FHA) protein